MALRFPAAVAALGLTLAPRLARADCPDGWFCDEGAPEQPPSEPARPAPAVPAAPAIQPRPVAPGEPTIPEEPLPPPLPPAPTSPRSEFALNMHLELGLFGAGAADGAMLGGLGIAFRFRPLPVFAVDVGLELLGGTDYNGNDRAEQAFVGNTLLFFNPGDPVQGFALAGFNVGGAQARIAYLGGQPVPIHDASYAYLGVQAGLGLEWRITRDVALTGDFQMFGRGRIDSGSEPEYVEPGTHLTTNASGGGLLRAGVTFYF